MPALLPENPEQTGGLRRRRGRRLLLQGLLLRRGRRTRGGLFGRSALLDRGRRRRGRLWRVGGRRRADDGRVGDFTVGQPDIVDRMLDAVQAGARRIHPARENPLHLALQRDLVDLAKGVRIGGFRCGAGVAGVGFHPQRAELDGFADILVEIDDAPGDLVEPGKARLLVDDLLRRRLGDDLVAGLQGGRRLRHALGLALARRQSRQRIGARGRDGDALARLRRRYRDRRRRILGNDGGAGRWCQGLRLHRPGRRYALPRQRTIGRRQQPALRQFRHFFFIVRRRLRLAAAGNIAGRARRRVR